MSTTSKLKTACGILAAAAAAGLAGGSWYLAGYTMDGRRLTPEESMAWQKDHYDVAWYQSVDVQEYTVRSYDGYELHAQFCPARSSSGRFVIFSHGFTDTRFGALKYMKLYRDAGFDCILYDLRGHGVNRKDFCTFSAREARDLKAMIDDAYRRFGQDIRLGLHGESLGAATAVAVLAYAQNLSFVVADCGFSDISNVLAGQTSRFHLPGCAVKAVSVAAGLRYGYSFDQMRPVDALADNHVPILFIHGADDDFVLPENSIRMHRACSSRRRIFLMPEARHAQSVLVHPDLYRDTVLHFLRTDAGIL